MAGIALLAFLFEVTHLNEFVVMATFSLVTTQTDAAVFTGNDGGSSSFEHSDRCFGTSAEQRYKLGFFKIHIIKGLALYQISEWYFFFIPYSSEAASHE